MARIPIPKKSFLNDCDYLGAFDNVKRWRSKDKKRYYTWDSLHGEIEVFNERGKHLAVFDPDGNFKKQAIKGRSINV